jgi:hypothetical protein
VDEQETGCCRSLTYYHPDYFGVQEALPEQMKDIKNGLKNYDYVGVGRDDGKEKGEFSAIFMIQTDCRF